MTAQNDSSVVPRSQNKRGWIHFGVAAAILGSMAVGWGPMKDALNVVTQKEAVRWPDGVVIDRADMRLANFPREVGNRFSMSDDGDIIIPEDIMDILGIGGKKDQERFDDRSSNWHIVRYYVDKRESLDHPWRLWRVELYYYTGLQDKVPHIPERCLDAGGEKITGSSEVVFSVPTARKHWNKEVPFQRVLSERQGKYGSVIPHVTYYTFSLNGKPENSWKKVRLELADPRVRRIYFAKMQFTPMGEVANIKQADKAAEDFINYFLPVVLQTLPTPEDVDEAEKKEQAAAE